MKKTVEKLEAGALFRSGDRTNADNIGTDGDGIKD